MSLIALALALGWTQQVPPSQVCPDGTVILASDTCPERAPDRRGRCTLREGQAPALHDTWLFELRDKIMSAGPADDAGRYLGYMTDRGRSVMQGTLVGKGATRVAFAFSTESETIDGSPGHAAAIVPVDAEDKPVQAPSRYVCRFIP